MSSKISLYNISFEVTNQCNLDCLYCYNHWKKDEVFKELNSYIKAIKTLKQLFKIADIERISFTGGEPFLSERFLEIILFCRLQNKKVSIISNGNTGKLVDYKQCIEMGVSLFQFPFLSQNPEIHDNLTNVNGSWDNTCTSILEIVSQGGKVVPVIVLTKQNHLQLAETITFISELGLNQIMLNRYNIGGKYHYKNLALNKAEINSAFKIANDLAKQKGMIITSNVCSPICYINPELYPNIWFGHCSDDMSIRPITVNINGDVRLCNHSPIIAGNIFKQKFEDIFQTSYSKSWSETKPEFCINCDLYSKCKGGCRAASEQIGTSLNNVDPIIHCS